MAKRVEELAAFEVEGHLLHRTRVATAAQRAVHVGEVGMKAAGLSVVPPQWTPPFFVISTNAYALWRAPNQDRATFLLSIAREVSVAASRWQDIWNRGLLLRSSAVGESLADRGENETIALPADYDAARVAAAIETIYTKFFEAEATGEMAVVVQARVSAQAAGHLSNEQRISKTRNHWVCEVETAPDVPRRFNTQRDTPPRQEVPLTLESPVERALVKRFRQLGRWCTLLDEGRAHIEWGATTRSLWVFQLDFEEDQPDDGHDPEELLRNVDRRTPGDPPDGSVFKRVDSEKVTGWRKIDKVSEFLVGRDHPYPKLFWVTGDELVEALEGGKALDADLTGIVHGRAICRTDCHNKGIPTLNLPRTESVSERRALDFMSETLDSLGLQGAAPSEVCFILHKFIPATSAAWAVAYPDKQIVRVDTLWGLPDGLQFLPHDTFEYDTKRQEISSERIRFKPKFLQETEDGSWRVIKVGRHFARRKSLSSSDTSEVANQTYQIAQRTGRPIQIMWFCGIPDELGIGRNVPWFSMPPERQQSGDASISPTMKRFVVRNMEDLSAADLLEAGRFVLYLSPEDPDLFRSDDFLSRIAAVAEAKVFPIIITGSILSHAFYMLEKRGLTVVSADEPARARTRQRRIFNKLVRDNIPEQISRHGERAALATISKTEARPALVVKLLEEAHELLEARTPSEVTAELADLLEVVRSLCSATGTEWGEVQAFAQAKRDVRGSFDRNVVLVETSWPSDNQSESRLAPVPIKLADLGSIRTDGIDHIVPFAALLAQDALRRVRLSDGTSLSLSMNGEGIVLREEAEGVDSSHQLELKF